MKMRVNKTHQTVAGHDPEFLDFIGNIYQAGLEPERWPAVLKQLSVAFDADLACIYTPVVAHPEQALYFTHNLSDSTQADYSAYYNKLDTWTLGALERDFYVQGNIAFGEQLVSQRDLHRTEFYNDFLRPNGMEWIVTTALFDGHAVPQTPATHMTFTRHADHAAFEPGKIKLIEMFAPHVRRALLTHWRLTEARVLQNYHASAIERLGYGLMLLDVDSKVLHLNKVAEQVVQAADGLSIRAGRLLANTPKDNNALRKLISEACLNIGGGLYIQRSGGHGSNHGVRKPYGLTASPLREGQDLTVFDLHPITLRPGAILLIHDPERIRPGDSLKLFATHYRLTPAEERVLTLLLNELAPKQIADRLGVGIRTVRTQLSSLYTKTGTSNQRDLIVLALGSGVLVT
jgi:DNA-binding CsgD family transcriptional regulator